MNNASTYSNYILTTPTGLCELIQQATKVYATMYVLIFKVLLLVLPLTKY